MDATHIFTMVKKKKNNLQNIPDKGHWIDNEF